jgi:hypothetical protein
MSNIKKGNAGSSYMQSVFLIARAMSNAPKNNIPESA